MGRQKSIARSVALPLTEDGIDKPANPLVQILALFSAFFSFYQLPIVKVRPEVFRTLRQTTFKLTDEDYVAAFQPEPSKKDKHGDEAALHAIGDMGFSGSTFYATSNQQFLVKSIPRYSEHSFFEKDLLEPYAEHMSMHPTSLLVRICDFLASPSISIGRTLRLAPSHHIVMENILHGQGDARENWEHWDLKPTSYFYPERDIADGRLTSEATQEQLHDEFHDKIILTQDQADELLMALEQDTKVLADHNAVDYSLFLVRIKTEKLPVKVINPATPEDEDEVVPTEPPFVPPSPPSWRAGIPSPDGKHIYRAALLDFFWAKHKVQPKLMTVLITLWNVLISRQGHMSITTTPNEYRERFLQMCREIVEVKKQEEEEEEEEGEREAPERFSTLGH